jgi:hypothetical protein
MAYDDWGTDHPDYSKASGGKARWSDAEIDYIHCWRLKNDQRNNVQSNGKIYAHCRKAIMDDKTNTLAIFHARHIESSVRIRGGFENLAKRECAPLPFNDHFE